MHAIEQIISPFQFRHLIAVEHLPRREADFLKHAAQAMQVGKGEILFQQGSYARGVYFLEQGKLKIYQEKTAGSRRLLQVYTSGDMLGYRPLLTDGLHTCTAETLEACRVQFVPKSAFEELLAESPYFAQVLLRAVSLEFAAWSNFQMAFDSSPVRSRIALALLILHEKYRLPGNATAVIHFSRTDLAEYVVASLETVVRILSELRESGIVHLNGRRMLINDMDALIALAIPSRLAVYPGIA